MLLVLLHATFFNRWVSSRCRGVSTLGSISQGSTGLLALIVTLTILTNVVFIALCFMLRYLGEVGEVECLPDYR